MAKVQRRQRIPFSGNRRRLHVPDEDKDPNFEYRWINDDPGRIEAAKKGGWETVSKGDTTVGDPDVTTGNTDLGSATSLVVGKHESGAGKRAVLMRIPREWYDEDQAAKEEVNRATDEAITRGQAGGQAVENAYGEVSLKRNR